MKLVFCLFILIVGWATVSAQNLVLSTDTVDLGVVYENQPDSALVYLKNNSASWSFFAIEHVAAFPFYGDTVVSLRFTNQLVYQGDSLAIWVVAKPEHNIVHSGSIVVLTGGLNEQVIIPYKFQGRYSKTYYNASENKTEAALRTQLKNTISAGYISLSYNSARDEMYGNLDNLNGDVECVYTGRTATFNTRAGANSNSFNCEHTFPQGFFNENLPMKSDIHHLFPTDVTANSQRGNLPFGVVTNPSWQNGGSKKNSTTFEPRDAHKGTAARAMMYFVLRYQDYSNFFAGQENILRQWHEQYPPTVQDTTRNQGIYALQSNRNPFVDYPQFSERITALVGTTQAPAQPAIFHFDTVTVDYIPQISSTRQYAVWLYNYGNQDLQMSNFQLSGNLSFASGSGVNTTLAPKQALKVEIEYTPGQDHSGETLTFDTNPTTSAIKTIYFNSLVPMFGLDESELASQIKITHTQISWLDKNTPFHWQVVDVSGRVIRSGESQETQIVEFNEFNNGVYFFCAQTAFATFTTKFIVTNH